MPAPKHDCDVMFFGIGMYAWAVNTAVLLVLGLAGCADRAPEPFPRVAACTQFEADTLSAASPHIVPSIVPAPFGVRIIVDITYNPFVGASAPVPGGRMVWNVWVYRWFDGDHLGAIGRVADAPDDPIGGVCQWYEAL